MNRNTRRSREPISAFTWVVLICSFAPVTTYSKVLTLTKLWNGSEPSVKVNVSVSMENESQFSAPTDIILDVRAPYFQDLGPLNLPNTTDSELWNTTDVVGLVFMNPENLMVQIDLNPEGRYHIQMYDGETLLHPKVKPEVQFSPMITSGEWKALVRLPMEMFPPRVSKVALYSWLGRPSNRTYYTLNTVPRMPSNETISPVPALRHPQAFENLEFNILLPLNSDGPPSKLWAELIPTMHMPEVRNNTTAFQRNSSEPRTRVGTESGALPNSLPGCFILLTTLAVLFAT